jgi:hypothetical protein
MSMPSVSWMAPGAGMEDHECLAVRLDPDLPRVRQPAARVAGVPRLLLGVWTQVKALGAAGDYYTQVATEIL